MSSVCVSVEHYSGVVVADLPVVDYGKCDSTATS